MDQAAAVTYGLVSPGGRRLVAGGLLLALLALILGAPAALGWLPRALLGAPLAALAGAALFTLPGLALLRLLPAGELAPAERLAAALCLSVAAPPLLLLLASLVGLRWSPALCWALLVACAAVALWPRPGAAPLRLPARVDPELALLAAIFGLALAVRLYIVRDLPAGLFGDSYHHTVITQLLVEHGGLFRSWRPYAPLTTLTYHYGFHSLGAWLHWLSGYPVPQSVVAVAQVAGAIAAPGGYLLARRLAGSPRAGLWAAAMVGLVSVFPAYYVNWGRYTQLAGQTVLPAACLAWTLLLDRAAAPGATARELARPAALAAVATAGVALCHYRIGLFAACFVLLYALYLLAARVRSRPALARLAGAGLVAGAAALLLTLPWLLRLREGQMLRMAGYYLSNNIGNETGNDLSLIDLERAAANGLLPLAGVGVVALLLRRRWAGLILPAWGGLVWLLANPFLAGLPGAGIISSFTATLAAYLVLGPLAGVGLAALFAGLAWAGGRLRAAALTRALRPLELVAAAALLAWGLRGQAAMLDLRFQVLTPADLAAAEWVREELPPGARVFVNSFAAYGGYIYVGTDGGWWLPLLSGSDTNLDPVTYGFEAGEQPDYIQLTIDHNRAVLDHPVDSPAAAAALKAEGYAYLYNGPAANPAAEYIDPARVDASPLYERIYSRDGVAIWRVR
jgi:hypothetical protein